MKGFSLDKRMAAKYIKAKQHFTCQLGYLFMTLPNMKAIQHFAYLP